MGLNGAVQAPGGPEEDTDGGLAHGGWSMPYFDPVGMGSTIDEVMGKTDGLPFGRRTCRTMATVWPERADDPFADRLNALPEYVASRTLTQDELTWSARSCCRPTTRSARCVTCGAKPAEGCRSGAMPRIAAQLIAHDLVDEYLLMIEPVLSGWRDPG